MSSRPPLKAAKIKRRRRGDERHRHKAVHKNLPLPYDLLEVMGLLFYSVLMFVLFFSYCGEHCRERWDNSVVNCNRFSCFFSNIISCHFPLQRLIIIVYLSYYCWFWLTWVGFENCSVFAVAVFVCCDQMLSTLGFKSEVIKGSNPAWPQAGQPTRNCKLPSFVGGEGKTVPERR